MDQLDVTTVMQCMQKPTVVIQTFRSDQNKMSSLDQTLQDMQPDYVIMYNTNVTAIRQIETFEARLQRHPKRRLKVFVLMHAKTVEEQSFLTNLRREKKAFELLIHTKSIMVVPENQDGKTEVTDHANDEEEEVSTRQAGGQVLAKKEPPRIIVDSREFRSELPCLIHKRGIEIVPLMITVGDYILSPEICVERKSISDLIGSLNSGRLYNQCQQMTRFYSRPILLIEFDQGRPFHLQGRYMLSRDSDTNNAEIMQKLQLLTIHFPKLRLVWSPSPYATAQLFQEIKQNKAQPDPTVALQTGSDDQSQELDAITEKYNANVHDFLMKLPGINLKNIDAVMRHGKNLKELLKMDEKQLCELLGNSKDAKAFWNIFHMPHKPKQEEPKGGKFKKTYKKF
jgi:DNA excision repair protein ERCC-4